VKDASKDTDCIFCAKPAEDDDRASFIAHRGEHCYVILNTFPYTNGHFMVAPFEHVARLQDLDPDVVAELMELAQSGLRALDDAYGPEGYNVGFNQGKVAGAGFEGHIHLHVVPRWAGDTNYMPVLADTRVLPQTLEDSYEALRAGF
jgi:ATP adenylyltransferase